MDGIPLEPFHPPSESSRYQHIICFFVWLRFDVARYDVDLRQGRDLSALLTAMAPLVLASELAWGEVDVDVDNAKAVSDADDVNHGLSPAALRPLSRMSREEQQVKKKTIPSSD